METSAHWKYLKQKENVIPLHGEYGGPLCCIVAKYEDGTEVSFNQSVLKQYIRADLVDGLITEVNALLDFLPEGWEVPLGYTTIVGQVKAALAKLKD